MNPSASPPGHPSTGIYFICNKCSGAEAKGNEILNTFYGVIFAAGLDKNHVNTLKENQIHDIKCDSVTIAGYGRVEANTIYNTGWDCENGPISGGGIYCLNGPGGELIGNIMYDQCGMNIDIDGCTNLTIKGNDLKKPGFTFGGSAPWCVGAQSMGLIDVASSTIEGNTVTNTGRPSNRLGLSGDPNKVFRPSGGPAYADLPGGGNAAVAFTLSQRPNTGFKTTGNTLVGNTFIANCASPCLGVGFFASRSTGFGAGGAWSAGSTNYFTKNSVNGSQFAEPALFATQRRAIFARDNVMLRGSALATRAPETGGLGQRHPFPAVAYTRSSELVTLLARTAGAFPRDRMDERLASYLTRSIDQRPPAWDGTRGVSPVDAFAGTTHPPRPREPDGDGDGIPDVWEAKHGLDPKGDDAQTLGRAIGCERTRTALECWLDDLADAITPR